MFIFQFHTLFLLLTSFYPQSVGAARGAQCDGESGGGVRGGGAPIAQSVSPSHSRPLHTHTHARASCLLKCIHLLSFSSLHGAPRLTQPCDDDTIILLIRTALGAVWEQLGGACTQTHTHADERYAHTASAGDSHCCCCCTA